MDWTDSSLTLICELMAEQVKKGKRNGGERQNVSVF
jgi:hypothetical protein